MTSKIVERTRYPLIASYVDSQSKRAEVIKLKVRVRLLVETTPSGVEEIIEEVDSDIIGEEKILCRLLYPKFHHYIPALGRKIEYYLVEDTKGIKYRIFDDGSVGTTWFGIAYGKE